MKSRGVYVSVATAVAGIVLVASAVAGGRKGSETTLTGRVVDLQCFMSGEYASSDHAKSTRECLAKGVPAALETDDGVVVIGHGMKSPGALLAKHAFQYVELTGKLYDHGGIKYIDATAVTALPEDDVDIDALDRDEEEEESEDW